MAYGNLAKDAHLFIYLYSIFLVIESKVKSNKKCCLKYIIEM